MKLSELRIASLGFALSALLPLGAWFMLLLPDASSGVPFLQNAGSFLAYVFTDAEVAPSERVHYILLAVLPAMLVLLSVMTWRQASQNDGRCEFWCIYLGWVATVIALAIFYWPSAIVCAMAMYHAGKRTAD